MSKYFWLLGLLCLILKNNVRFSRQRILTAINAGVWGQRTFLGEHEVNEETRFVLYSSWTYFLTCVKITSTTSTTTTRKKFVLIYEKSKNPRKIAKKNRKKNRKIEKINRKIERNKSRKIATNEKFDKKSKNRKNKKFVHNFSNELPLVSPTYKGRDWDIT